MSAKVEKVVGNHHLPEGPHWDAESKSLYYVDVLEHSIHKYTPSTKTHVGVHVGYRVSFIIPVENKANQFLMNLDRKIVRISWDGKNHITVLENIYEIENPALTFNDAKCDGQGRLWIGTCSNKISPGIKIEELGCLNTLNPKREFQEHLKNVEAANGIATNSKQEKLYFVDSMKCCIFQFDLNVKEETISNQQTIFSCSLPIHGLTGFPDGMAIDSDGNLWVALFGSYKIIKINPAVPETLLSTIDLPAEQVTSLAFGGDQLDEIYVTTANFNSPGDGALYKITNIGSRGAPVKKICLE